MADKKNQRFTFDPEKEGAEVPTLTSLLYKKNVVKSAGSSGKGRAARIEEDHSRIVSLEPTMTMDTTTMSETNTDPAAQVVISSLAATRAHPAASSSVGAPPVGEKRIVPASRPFSGPALVPLTRPDLYPSGAPAGGGVRHLCLTSNPSGVIVFKVQQDPETLVVESIVGPSPERNLIWSGMSFSKRDFADLWGRLEKFGFAEFSTLGISGQGNSDRTAFRAAFQAKANEWITLVRVKTPSGGDALVVAFTGASIQAVIPAFQTACLGVAAKAA
jgi:hypothetical protein